MGLPVSTVVAEIVMQHLEERALATCHQTISLWLHYVDDTFIAVHKDEIDAFHDHLNEQNPDIQFNKEIEENGKLPFPAFGKPRQPDELRTTVHRKRTHSPTDYSTNHPTTQIPRPTSQNVMTIKTLTRRAH